MVPYWHSKLGGNSSELLLVGKGPLGENAVGHRSREWINGPVGEDSTQTIELTDMFTSDVTTTGSFDVSSGIWKTTFGKVIQALPIPILLTDSHYRVVVVNRAWGRLVENYEDMVSRVFSEFLPDDSAAQNAQSSLEKTFLTRKSRVAQAALRIGERKIWARMTFRSMRISQERFVLVLIEDLTVEKQLLEVNKKHSDELEKIVQERTSELTAMNERLQKEIADRKRAEDLWLQSERLKAVGELASGTAHNFNNMLQIIINAARSGLMNLESNDFTKVKYALEQVLQNAEVGAETVRRLQSFTSIRDGNEPLADTVFDLGEVVRPAVELTKSWWKTHPEKQGVRVDLKLDLADGCTVQGKRHEIFEVVVNLIKNASEALPHGGLIEIACRAENDKVVLEVRDNGRGISQDMLNKLFIPFSTTKLTTGAGLGLATSWATVKGHGGDISVDSVEGKGSVFKVTLPKSPELPKAPSVGFRTPGVRPLRILVIDDIEEVLNLLAEGLREFNHTVHAARSGREGLEIFRREAIDVVVCDLGMPGMTGWEVGRRIMEVCREIGLTKTPFTLLTGWGDQVRELAKMRSAGVDRILVKPIDVPRLLDVLQELVEAQEAGA